MNIIDKSIEEFEKKFEHWDGVATFLRMELEERDIEILKMRKQKHTLKEISKQFNITPERIRQIEAKAYEKVKMKDYVKLWLRDVLLKVQKEATNRE